MYNTEELNAISEKKTGGLSGALFKKTERLGHNITEVRREGAAVYDMNNKKYIDGISSAGITNLGRNNSAVKAALKSAVRRTDQGNFPMISIEKSTLAEKLARFTPGDLECSVFSVIRGESIDFACKLARGYTGRTELIYPEGSFFGQTGFALSLSDHAVKGDFGNLIPDTIRMPFGDLAAAEKMITDKTAGVFIEPIQAENGCKSLSPAYLKGLSEICKKTGTLLIMDETQTGMGRCGARFACEKAGVIPDILVLGESIGAGLFPIAATIFSQELNKFMNAHPMIHLSTFGGSDIGCLTAIAALDEYDRLTPWENAEKTGTTIRNGLLSLMEKYPEKIVAVNGEGLLIGIDLGTSEKAERFCKAAAENGLLVKPGEVAQRHVIIRPSLLITLEEAVEIMASITNALEKIED